MIQRRFSFCALVAFFSACAANAPPPSSASERADDEWRVPLAAISIEGNREIATDEIRSVIAGALPALHPDAVPMEETGDGVGELSSGIVARVLVEYYDRGYVQAEVESDVRPLPAGVRVLDGATLTIREGPRFRLASLEVAEEDEEGARVESFLGPDALRSAFSVTPGEFFARRPIALGILSIGTVYRDAGYAFVDVMLETELELHPEPPSVHLRVRIRRGRLATIDRIEILGASPAAEQAVRAALEVAPGERYHETRLLRSVERIRALGLFDRVEPSTNVTEDGGDRVVVRIEVVERT